MATHPSCILPASAGISMSSFVVPRTLHTRVRAPFPPSLVSPQPWDGCVHKYLFPRPQKGSLLRGVCRHGIYIIIATPFAPLACLASQHHHLLLGNIDPPLGGQRGTIRVIFILSCQPYDKASTLHITSCINIPGSAQGCTFVALRPEAGRTHAYVL